MSRAATVTMPRAEREALELVVTRADTLARVCAAPRGESAVVALERVRKALDALAKLRGGVL